MNDTGVVLRSRGFSIWKRWESESGQRKTLETIAEETGLGLTTVRTVLAKADTDVSGVTARAIAILAAYFSATQDEFTYLDGEPVRARKG